MSDTDPTAPWWEFLSYCRCSESLNRPVRIGAFMKYQKYLREMGVI